MKKIFYAVLTLFCLIGCSTNLELPNIENDILDNKIIDEDKNVIVDETLNENPLEIHFIDVGQADCILIKSNNEAMLIDAGNNDDANTITNYLNNENIEELKYVIGTHPHEDHIGSLDVVINKFDIENIIMPQKASTTKTFEDVVTAIENKELLITAPKVGDEYKIGDAKFTIIAPVKEDYGSNLNDYSVGILLTYGNNKFVFTGDAEEDAEYDVLSTGINIKADLLKLGHHGSSTSSSMKFLEEVAPKYAIITCGVDNSYGHPHTETMDKMLQKDITVYRTDLQGNIVVISDGNEIVIKTAKNNSSSSETKQDTAISYNYVLNTNSKTFHYSSCSGVQNMSEKNKQTFTGAREEVIQKGYKSCGICKP